MNAFSVASELLGDLELAPGQLAQLRAIDHKYQQRIYTLLHGGETPGPTGTRRELTADEAGELRASLEKDILAMLTPEQRARKQRG